MSIWRNGVKAGHGVWIQWTTMVTLKTDLLKIQDGIPCMKLVSMKTDLLKLQVSMSLNGRWTLAMSLDMEARTLAMSLDLEARTLAMSLDLEARTLAMSLDLEARTLAMSLDMEARTLLLWRASISHPHLLKTSSPLSLSVSFLGKTLGHPPVT
ncbi:uncharacterized protein LOC132475919 isoform X4 [Gadus macrocephalus]|uniref:uncharacterized protein LOC132475919 isoform X4 n=1 Tax=Gadus macrocephalus TaxID=80720 RepID=UPI0028CB453E|nr:uncharacterized protein LOC132475919 isoform X4 [Gadus macrocephalus]